MHGFMINWHMFTKIEGTVPAVIMTMGVFGL
jgi:hypothetical protein